MAFVPTPNGAKLVMPMNGEGLSWSNTLWFTMPDFESADMVALANVVQACFYGALDTLLGSAVQYGPPVVYDMRSEEGEIQYGTDDPEGGEGTGDLLNPAIACCLTLRSASRGRSARGRIYVAGFTESNAGTKTAWSSNITGALNTLGGCIIEEVASIGWTWVVRSIQHNLVKLSTAVTYPIVTAEVRSATMVTQRRRTGRD